MKTRGKVGLSHPRPRAGFQSRKSDLSPHLTSGSGKGASQGGKVEIDGCGPYGKFRMGVGRE